MDRMRKAAVLAGGAVLVWTGVASAQDPAAAPPVTTTVGATATVGTETAAAAAAPSAVSEVDLGKPGTFVIDQVSGFRGRVGGGVGFYGPLGVAYNSFSGATGQQVDFSGTTPVATSTETTIRSWSIWLAPSIDYFLVENLSIGGLFAVDTTFGSAELKTTRQTPAGNQINSAETDLPTVTSFTLMPRVGYFLRVYSDRVSLWPRVGLGYFRGSNATVMGSGSGASSQTQSVDALLLQLDVGIIYQITDNVFFRIAPAVTFSTNGGSTVKYKNLPASSALRDAEGDGSAFQFELTSGFGANFSL